MIRQFCLVVALSVSVAIGPPGNAQQQCANGRCYMPTAACASNQYVQGVAMSESAFQSCSQPYAQTYASYSIPAQMQTYAQPACSQPVYSQPAYSQPAYSQQVCSQPVSQPAYSQPVYSQPVYSQQVYSPPTYTSCNSCPPAYVQTTSQPVYMASTYPTTHSIPSYSTTSYPTSTYTYANSSYSSPSYSTSPTGTFATYPSAAASSSYIPSYTTTSAAGMTSSGLAQQKAQQMAQMNLRGHPGGGLGGARYEGVGWSSVSPQDAVRQCCYWGQRPAQQIGVARGSDGCWYACVLYR